MKQFHGVSLAIICAKITGMRRIIGGIVGGSLAAAVGTGVYGLLGHALGGSEMAVGAVQAGVLAGTGFGIASAFVTDKLPANIVVRVAVLF